MNRESGFDLAQGAQLALHTERTESTTREVYVSQNAGTETFCCGYRFHTQTQEGARKQLLHPNVVGNAD